MVDIAAALETLQNDTGRCPTWPAAAVRRRGDHRRTAARVAATGVTVTLVGATAGTGYAVAQERPASHHPGGRIGIADQTSTSPAPPVPVPSTPATGTPQPAPGTATPIPSRSPTATARPTTPSSPTPSLGPGTAQPIASPTNGSSLPPQPADGPIATPHPTPTSR